MRVVSVSGSGRRSASAAPEIDEPGHDGPHRRTRSRVNTKALESRSARPIRAPADHNFSVGCVKMDTVIADQNGLG